MTIFIFLLFYFYLFFVGRGSLILLSRLNKKHLKDINNFRSNQDVTYDYTSNKSTHDAYYLDQFIFNIP